MLDSDDAIETDRKALLSALVTALESALPEGTPSRTGGQRTVEHVLVPGVRRDDVAPLLASIQAGPGGELRPTKTGQVAFASAESSALMAVNFLAPYVVPGRRLLGVRCNKLSAERELRVAGVRTYVGPTLDAVIAGPDGTVCVEAKCAEPWRGRPKVNISDQYLSPAKAVSSDTLATLRALQTGALRYCCLDAAQLIKHLLGVHSALKAGVLTGPSSVTLLFWRPAEPGRFCTLFDRLEAEFDDLASRLADQPVTWSRWSTRDLLDAWSAADAQPGEALHAATLHARYDVPLAR